MRTKNFPEWDGQPYFPISRFYKNTFRDKVYKITVSAAQTCPNRARNNGIGCIFCDELGSAGSHLIKHMPLARQITINREKLRQRFKVNKFLVYFQPFTNTFRKLQQLQSDVSYTGESNPETAGSTRNCSLVLRAACNSKRNLLHLNPLPGEGH